MPVMVFVMALNLASGLSLYWVISNAFQVVQTLLINNPFKIRRERERLLVEFVNANEHLKKRNARRKNGNKYEHFVV